MNPPPANLTEPAPPRATPEALLAAARQAVRQYFSSCFWFWREPDVALTTTEDVRSVIENLRENGNHDAWRTAQQLQRMLLQCH
jgi:hypothetical protein